MVKKPLNWQERGKLWLRIGVRLFVLLATVLFFTTCGPLLWDLFLPFLLALVVAWVLNPAVRGLQKTLHVPRGLLSILMLLVVFAGSAVALGIAGYRIVMELSSLVENWESLWGYTQLVVEQISAFADRFMAYIPGWLDQWFSLGMEQVLLWLQKVLPEFAGEFGSRAGTWAMGIPSFIVALIVFLMGSYFITADYPNIRFQVTSRMPKSVQEIGEKVKESATMAFGGYIRAQAIITTGVFFILLIGFLVMGEGYALLLALGLSVLDFIPLIGSGTVMVPWAIVDVLMGNWHRAINLILVWAIVCLFRRLAEPKIMGTQTGLSPILSLMSLYVGMKLAGVGGMIFGPLVCLIIVKICVSGIFDGVAQDVTLVMTDMSAILADKSQKVKK